VAPSTRLLFCRHGEVQADMVGSFLGRTDAPLSDLGRHQAEAMGAYLGDAPIDAVVVSPLKRALDTAAPLARALHQKLEVRREFREMDYGDWDGLHWPQIEGRDPELARRWQADPQGLSCPGGESGQSFQDRVAAALDGLLAEFAGRQVALVSHAGVNRVVLAELLGRRFVDAFVFVQDYGCVNAAAWSEHGGHVVLVNFVPGPKAAQTGD
jgi:broad specificity phosphatase PhoE